MYPVYAVCGFHTTMTPAFKSSSWNVFVLFVTDPIIYNLTEIWAKLWFSKVILIVFT